MNNKVQIDRRKLVALLFRLDHFGDTLISQGNQYKSLVQSIRHDYLFKTRNQQTKHLNKQKNNK